MSVVLHDVDLTLYHADVLEALAEMGDGSVDCVATSPPYWSLRDYKVEGQFGLEETPREYVFALVSVFREIHRVLADHGTVWLNLGDSYVSAPNGNKPGDFSTSSLTNPQRQERARIAQVPDTKAVHGNVLRPYAVAGLKQKDMVGIPWRVAFALQEDGWWLRAENIWDKCNPMPESVRDRPTKAHEQVFLLTKSARYWYDKAAVAEPAEWARWGDQTVPKHEGTPTGSGWMPSRTKQELVGKATYDGFNGRWDASVDAGDASVDAGDASVDAGDAPTSRNMRTVWRIPTSPNTWAACEECDAVFDKTKDAERHKQATGHKTTGHFAAFPPDLVRRCILAGCPLEVCTACGKPRERIEERTFYGNLRSADNKDGHADLEQGITRNEFGGQKRWSEYEPPTTVGWTDCGCGVPFRQGVVLDPFLGSGTTAVVAREEGRACVGIELSEPYTRIIVRRLQQQSIFPEIA